VKKIGVKMVLLIPEGLNFRVNLRIGGMSHLPHPRWGLLGDFRAMQCKRKATQLHSCCLGTLTFLLPYRTYQATMRRFSFLCAPTLNKASTELTPQH
jgi:hypothetical protein